MWWAKGRAAKDEEGPCAALQASRVWCGGERAAERPSAPLAQSCLGTSGGEVRGVSEARVRGVCLGACVWGRVFGGVCANLEDGAAAVGLGQDSDRVPRDCGGQQRVDRLHASSFS